MSNQASYGGSVGSTGGFRQNSFSSSGSGLSPTLGQPSFLDNKNMNDPAVLRKMVAELEAENKRLKDA